MQDYFSKFFYILSDQKKSLILILLSVFFTSSLETFGIGLIGPFLALANNPNFLSEIALLNKLSLWLNLKSQNYFIALLGLLIICIFLVKSVLTFNLKRSIFKYSFNNQGNLRLRLFTIYLTVPYTFHLTRNTATAIQNIVNETNQFNSLLLEILNSSVNIIILSLLILLLVITNIVAMSIISITLLGAFLIYYRFRRQFSEWGKIMSKTQDRMIRIVNHGLGGIKETKLLGCQPYFTEQLAEQVYSYADVASGFLTFGMLPRITIEVIVITFIIGLTSLSLLFHGSSEHLLATLGIFGVVAVRLITPVTQLTSGFAKIRSNNYIVNKLYNDLKEIEASQLKQGIKYLDGNSKTLSHQKSSRYLKNEPIRDVKTSYLPFKKKIVIEGVCYRYAGNAENVLKDISLTINKGQSIALIGKSGAGKTTLVDIILGLLTPGSGDISVDGRSIYRDLRSWQNLVGYIPQSIFLMDDTIERNIAFGVPDGLIDPEKLDQAIKSAQLTELIKQLPQGVKTSIGERGVRLSGGQRQRIGIARALYYEREILVLDEATSALDNETEALITESIKFLSATKTMIIIAHRLSTVQHCDRIYLMKKGCIVKSGSYDEVVLGASLQQ